MENTPIRDEMYVSTIKWAVAKLADELGFFLSIDRVKGRGSDEALVNEYETARMVREKLESGEIQIVLRKDDGNA
jgi:nitrogen regulatory protein PII